MTVWSRVPWRVVAGELRSSTANELIHSLILLTRFEVSGRGMRGERHASTGQADRQCHAFLLADVRGLCMSS